MIEFRRTVYQKYSSRDTLLNVTDQTRLGFPPLGRCRTAHTLTVTLGSRRRKIWTSPDLVRTTTLLLSLDSGPETSLQVKFLLENFTCLLCVYTKTVSC